MKVQTLLEFCTALVEADTLMQDGSNLIDLMVQDNPAEMNFAGELAYVVEINKLNGNLVKTYSFTDAEVATHFIDFIQVLMHRGDKDEG